MRPDRAGTGLTGRLLVGTSGFSYPGWIPRLYPPGTPASRFLATYATRFDAVELNNTFRRRPTANAIAGWLRATPDDFRFAIKAQRGSAVRALLGSARDGVAWPTEPLPSFGERLGAVLFELPAEMRRDGRWCDGDVRRADAALAAVLGAWPATIPLVVELPDPSWHVDETFAALRATGATLCATDVPGHDEPTLRRTSSRHYLRLRRDEYGPAALDAWADRLRPFLEAGDDVFVFFKHDPVGHAAELATSFAERFERD
ncbi:MAG TPA: DUF72 domain-containing protein [Candidatus Limnocylindrales bacterium]